MVRHIVLFEFRRDATQDEIHSLKKVLAALKIKNPGIVNFNSGHNMSPEGLNKAFTYGFTMDFQSTQTRDDYLPHPDHQYVVDTHIMPLLANGQESILVFDFEI